MYSAFSHFTITVFAREIIPFRGEAGCTIFVVVIGRGGGGELATLGNRFDVN